MTDGDLVKVEIADGEIVSIVSVTARAEATHAVTNSWAYKDLSFLGLEFGEIIRDDVTNDS